MPRRACGAARLRARRRSAWPCRSQIPGRPLPSRSLRSRPRSAVPGSTRAPSCRSPSAPPAPAAAALGSSRMPRNRPQGAHDGEGENQQQDEDEPQCGRCPRCALRVWLPCHAAIVVRSPAVDVSPKAPALSPAPGPQRAKLAGGVPGKQQQSNRVRQDGTQRPTCDAAAFQIRQFVNPKIRKSRITPSLSGPGCRRSGSAARSRIREIRWAAAEMGWRR